MTNKHAHWAMAQLSAILARLELQLNTEKSRVVDAEKETFDFLGFTYRRVWDRQRAKRATIFYPSQKAQKRFRERVRAVVNAQVPVPLSEMIRRANLFLRGWVNYFRVGNSSIVFHGLRWYVETKVRRVLQRRAHRHGYGWKRYDRDFLYQRLGLFADYRVRW
jgi:hypothetical protein